MESREKIFWSSLKRSLPGVALRVENTVARGTPDVYWLFNGYHCWLELKVDDGKGTLIRPEQHAFAARITQYKGFYFVVSWLFHEEAVGVWRYPYETEFQKKSRRYLVTEYPQYLLEKRKQRNLTDIIFNESIQES